MTDDRPCIVTPCGGAAPRGAPVRAKSARHAVPPSAYGRAGGAAAHLPCSLGFQPNFPVLRGPVFTGGTTPRTPRAALPRAHLPPTALFPPLPLLRPIFNAGCACLAQCGAPALPQWFIAYLLGASAAKMCRQI